MARGKSTPAWRPLRRADRMIALGVAMTGLIVSLYPTDIHHRLRAEPGWQSACAISEEVNCNTVIQSRYGAVAGVPLSTLGAWFYLMIAVLAVSASSENRQRFPPRLRIEFRHYPLDAACNPRVQQSRHPGACLQARAAICADAQGRAAAFRDRLFEDGPKDFEGLLRLSAALGVDRDQLQSCLESDESARKLDESVKEAIAANVRATPTLFVNGTRHVGRLSDEDLSCLNRLR